MSTLVSSDVQFYREMRYFPTSLRLIPERNKGWRLWLVRGKDLAGNTYQNT